MLELRSHCLPKTQLTLYDNGYITERVLKFSSSQTSSSIFRET